MSASTVAGRAPRRGSVSVDELQRAWRAVQEGQFRAGPARAEAPHRPGDGGGAADPMGRALQPWSPPGPVIAVLGCGGSVGASTVAVALAEVLAETAPVRVVECGQPSRSGLAAASTAELGPVDADWTRGRRDRVVIDRLLPAALTGPTAVPPPAPAPPGLQVTVLDVGWDLDQVLAGRSWLGEQIAAAPAAVLVASASVPGLRHLEAAVTGLLRGPRRPARRRWGRGRRPGLDPVAAVGEVSGRSGCARAGRPRPDRARPA